MKKEKIMKYIYRIKEGFLNFFISRICFYVLTIMLSIVLILCSKNLDELWKNILISIGCSIIASSFMALFIERIDYKKTKSRLKVEKSIYHRELFIELKFLIGKIICFYELYKEDTIDWSYPVGYYTNPKFLLSQSKKDKKITYDTIIETLGDMETEFDIKQYELMDKSEQKKVKKIFTIILDYCKPMIRIINRYDENKIYLNDLKYLTLEENKQLFNSLIAMKYYMYTTSMIKQNTFNYGAVVIQPIKEILIKIKELGNYNDDSIDSGYNSFLL